MGSIGNYLKATNQNDEEDCLYAIQLLSGAVMPMVLESAIELNLFEIIAEAGEGAMISPSQIASLLHAKNPDAPSMLDRILRLLASYSVLTSSITTRANGEVERFYGLAPVCKYLVPNQDGVSFASWIHINQHRQAMLSWSKMKDAILEGGNPFTMVHGVNTFEHFAKNRKHGDLFNTVMFSHTNIILKKILEEYKGFEDVKELVDVGGGIGTSSSIITSKYPEIKCINYDLPFVVEHAPSYPRVKHVGGSMIESVPKGETIFMKWILHNWDDQSCLKLLKNCYEALPDHGKMIVVDTILPVAPESDTAAKGICQLDLIMMAYCPTGKERTRKEIESLAKEAGFAGIKVMCCIYNYSVMELYKRM